MKVTGIYKESQGIREIKEGTFARNFVVMIRDESPYPKDMPILFNIVGKIGRMALLDHFNEGDNVEVEFELNGRVSRDDEKKFYNNLSCKLITKI